MAPAAALGMWGPTHAILGASLLTTGTTHNHIAPVAYVRERRASHERIDGGGDSAVVLMAVAITQLMARALARPHKLGVYTQARLFTGTA